jgi:hypothetical protein
MSGEQWRSFSSFSGPCHTFVTLWWLERGDLGLDKKLLLAPTSNPLAAATMHPDLRLEKLSLLPVSVRVRFRIAIMNPVANRCHIFRDMPPPRSVAPPKT